MSWRINILGSGAIGGLCSAGAHKAKLTYRCFVRQGHNPLRYAEGLDGQITTLEYASNDSNPLGDNDLLIMPLKAFQLEDALRQWQGKISLNTPVVLLHNGMGGVELARDIIPDNPVLLATTSHGALKLNADTVKHTGLGSTMLGMAFEKKDRDH